MPILKTGREDIRTHIEALGLRPGMKVVVHSSLLSFGLVEGRAQTFIDELVRAVGDAGTVAAPAFTLKLAADEIFDPAETPCMTGALPEALRQQPSAVRSACPMHSYAAVGRDAGLMRRAVPDYSFGPGSCFEVFLEEGFHWLMLGCGARGEACTLLHHTEADHGVPYREWIKLPRRIRMDGEVRDIELNYYARKGDVELEFPFRFVLAQLIAEDRIAEIPAPSGKSYFCEASVIHEIGLEILKRDPWGLVGASERQQASTAR